MASLFVQLSNITCIHMMTISDDYSVMINVRYFCYIHFIMTTVVISKEHPKNIINSVFHEHLHCSIRNTLQQIQYSWFWGLYMWVVTLMSQNRWIWGFLNRRMTLLYIMWYFSRWCLYHKISILTVSSVYALPQVQYDRAVKVVDLAISVYTEL